MVLQPHYAAAMPSVTSHFTEGTRVEETKKKCKFPLITLYLEIVLLGTVTSCTNIECGGAKMFIYYFQ